MWLDARGEIAMSKLLVVFQLVVAAAIGAMLMTTPLRAEDAAPVPDEWQAVITGQIQAFRDHDPDAALSYAASGFKSTFSDSKVFFVTIMSGGYAPIMTSRSHSFGEFKVLGPDAVLQEVLLVDSDQKLYRAIYQLGREADGWRVQGVQMMKQEGIGV
jgi:hypothetical protein